MTTTQEKRAYEPGTRIRATNAELDEVMEFEVHSSSPANRWGGAWVQSKSCVSLYAAEGWTFEVLAPPKPKLPTQSGSIIKVVSWYKRPTVWTGQLTQWGWRFSADMTLFHSHQELTDRANVGNFEFEVLYVPGQEADQ